MQRGEGRVDDVERGGHGVGNGLDRGHGVGNGLDSRRVGIVDDDRATRVQSDNNRMAMAITTRTPTQSNNSNGNGDNITPKQNASYSNCNRNFHLPTMMIRCQQQQQHHTGRPQHINVPIHLNPSTTQTCRQHREGKYTPT